MAACSVALYAPALLLGAITPSIASISSPVFVGDSFTVTGSGFTAGSVANFFVATATGPINFGPLLQSSHTTTSLTVPVPDSKVSTLGQGVVSVVVVNTDQGFTQSNAVTAQLFGENLDGFPNLTTINGFGLATTSTEPSFATDNVQTVVVQNHTVTLGGNGFDTINGVAIDLFCDCPGGKIPTLFLNPGNVGLTATALTFILAPSAATGSGSFVISNSGPKGDYAIKSNAVSVPIGAAVTVSKVSQNPTGCTATVKGTGFAITGTGLVPLTAINLFNSVPGGVVNIGGLNDKGEPNIPLDVTGPNQFTFSLAAKTFVPGASYVQVLNPPFLPFTSSGNTPNGAFTMASCGATPTRTPIFTPTPTAVLTFTPTPLRPRSPQRPRRRLLAEVPSSAM